MNKIQPNTPQQDSEQILTYKNEYKNRCKVCHKLYNQPILLKCLHSVCYSCV